MNEIINLIRLTHPTALNEAIEAVENGTDIDEAAADIMAALYTDDTFNEYSEEQLTAAIAEMINEY